MNFNLQSFLSELGKAPLRAKLTVVACVLAVVGVLALAGMVAANPHFSTLYSGLDDAERVAVEKALAQGGIRFRASPPPAPYAIYVDDSQIDEAQISVALAEALTRTPTGIATGTSGANSIFQSAGERAQTMLKREWEETEHLLEQLTFVTRAVVRTSIPVNSPMSHKREPLTVSVTLHLRGTSALSSPQADTVAKLVVYRFGVPAENVLISDQAGRTLHDPSSKQSGGMDVRGLVEEAGLHDRLLAEKVNSALATAYGANKTLVMVTSEWNFDQSMVVAESIDPETVQLSVDKHESRTPQSGGLAVGGATGVTANLADPTADPAQLAQMDPIEATETTEKSVYDAARSRSQTVSTAPRLTRLSISLMIDDSLASKRDEIIDIVKAGVGFNSAREDVIGVSTTAFVLPEGTVLDEDGNPVPATAEVPAEDSSDTLELLMTRGVEIVAALGFVILLIMSLKGSKGGAPGSLAVAGSTERGGEGGLGEPDPSALARAQIEELVKSDPRRVGDILSSWANEDVKVKA